MIVVGLVYLVIGAATALLAQHAPSVRVRNLWRLAAWALSLVVFAGQLAYEHLRLRNRTIPAALHTAAAVALGAFALAIAGPVRTHWHTSGWERVALMALVLWPLITGLPAFVVALALGGTLGRLPSSSGTEDHHAR